MFRAILIIPRDITRGMWCIHNFRKSHVSQKTTPNSEPVISSTTANVTIPANTPFSLTAIATDPDAGDVLTYCWEQMDNQTGFTMPPSSTSTGGPMPRSLDPNTSPTRYFPDLQDLIAGSISMGSPSSVSRFMISE